MAGEPRVTAPKVMSVLDDHLKLHENKIDPKVHNHHIILFGDKGDDGLCADVKEIKRGYATMKQIGIAIIIAIATNILVQFIK
jgi:hypothetical protein